MNRGGYVRNDGPLWRYITMIDKSCKRPYFLNEELPCNRFVNGTRLEGIITDKEVLALGVSVTNPPLEFSESAQRIMRALGVHGLELK